jgi:hypothetical protein
VKYGFIRGNQIVPVFDNQFLPVFRTVAVSSYVLVEEMGVGDNPGILGNGECVVSHVLITAPVIDFTLIQELGELLGW